MIKNSNRSKAAGGTKAKRKKGGNATVNTSTPTNNTSQRQGRNIEKENGHIENENNSSGRQWVNGEDTRHNKSYKHNKDKGDDDRPFNMKSMASTNHSSFANSSRKQKDSEEDKERCRTQSNSFKNKKIMEECDEEGATKHLLRDYAGTDKFTLEGSRTQKYSLPFEYNQILQFGLDLRDNRKLSDSFKSPFYKYYDDCKVESLNSMDFMKEFKDNDETLLYIYYTMSNKDTQYLCSCELTKRGWILNEREQTWYTTRNVAVKGGKTNKSKTRPNERSEDNTEIKRYKFDINQWTLVETDPSSDDSCGVEIEKRLEPSLRED